LGNKKALVVRLGAIGDVIMTIPAAYQLHQQGFEIEWICGKVVQPLLECYPWIRLIPVDEGAILKGTPWQRARSIASVWRRLSFRSYELCATLYYDRRYLALTLPIRTRRRIALSLDSRSTALITGRSYTEEFARMMLGIVDDCRIGSLGPLPPFKLPAAPLPPKSAERRIAIVPGGASNVGAQQTLKRWPVDSYVALAEELQRRQWEILLLGGADDKWVLPHFRHLNVTDCIGKLSIPEVISVCNTCDAVVSHDTGPMHLAGLSRACLVGIFGPTNPGSFLPRRPGVVGLWGGQGYACRPCYDGKSFAPCTDAGCMREVSPELVLEQLDHLIENQAIGASMVSLSGDYKRTS
jgi:heptosyltransferase-2